MRSSSSRSIELLQAATPIWRAAHNACVNAGGAQGVLPGRLLIIAEHDQVRLDTADRFVKSFAAPTNASSTPRSDATNLQRSRCV